MNYDSCEPQNNSNLPSEYCVLQNFRNGIFGGISIENLVHIWNCIEINWRELSQKLDQYNRHGIHEVREMALPSSFQVNRR